MEITVLYLKIPRHQLSIYMSQIPVYSICYHQFTNFAPPLNIGPKSARGTQRNKNKSAQNRPMTYEGLNTQWRCKISKLMVANWVNGYLRHVNRQLMPWNYFIKIEAYMKPNNVWSLHFQLEVFIWRHVVYVPKSFSQLWIWRSQISVLLASLCVASKTAFATVKFTIDTSNSSNTVLLFLKYMFNKKSTIQEQ
jgi:hypothetical protein